MTTADTLLLVNAWMMCALIVKDGWRVHMSFALAVMWFGLAIVAALR
jgi:hypothetical protein